jgi:uncharacterized protein
MIRLYLSALTHARVGKQETVDLNVDHVFAGDLELTHLRGELDLVRVADGILIQGEIQAEAKTECTRCLSPYYEPITIELEDTIGLPGSELTPERPVRVDEEGWADLEPLVREYAWLGLPVRPLCSPDCQGICPECGGNRNLGECTCEDVVSIDPRWEALRKLTDESEEP